MTQISQFAFCHFVFSIRQKLPIGWYCLDCSLPCVWGCDLTSILFHLFYFLLLNGYDVNKASLSDHRTSQDVLRLPPLEDLLKFEDVYQVVFILDDREQFIRWVALSFVNIGIGPCLLANVASQWSFVPFSSRGCFWLLSFVCLYSVSSWWTYYLSTVAYVLQLPSGGCLPMSQNFTFFQ